MQPVKFIKDPITASIVMVDVNTADVTIAQGQAVRLSHPTALRAAIGAHLLQMGLTGNETAHVRTLHRREFPHQSNEWTDQAAGLTKAATAKLLKEARAK